jgi:toxin YoeB
MAGYSLKIEDNAKLELKKHYLSGNKASIKRIERIFKELAVHPLEGIGNPHPLKYQLSGYWSREINQKDRLVYRVDQECVTVYVVSAIGHYSDK